MKPKPLFQFSSFEDKTYINILIEAIKRLGGDFDESKTYSPKSTHLIVDKMECTEKILCFIAAGKWVVTHSYLKRCLAERKFVKEDEFHVSKRFKNSKLANVSLRWKDLIDDKKPNSPFFNWNVGLYLNDEEKAKALTKIIHSGCGEATPINLGTSFQQSEKFTLLIYDSHTKDLTKTLGLKLKVPCYPFQAIPDYLMQCIISDTPVLPMSYYEKLEVNDQKDEIDIIKHLPEPSEPVPEIEAMMQVPVHKIILKPALPKLGVTRTDQEFLISAANKKFFYCSSLHNTSVMNCVKPKPLSAELESVFFIMWQNNAYNEGLNLIVSLNNNERPSIAVLTVLLKFLMDKSVKNTSNFSHDSMDNNIRETIYATCYAYILNLLLNFPPNDTATIKFFSQAFKNLDLAPNIWNSGQKVSLKGLVDTLYLISIYEYFLIHSIGREEALGCSILLSLELDKQDVQRKLISQIVNDNTIKSQLCIIHKLLEVISFCDLNLQKKKPYTKKLSRFIPKRKHTNDSDVHLSDLISIFMK